MKTEITIASLVGDKQTRELISNTMRNGTAIERHLSNNQGSGIARFKEGDKCLDLITNKHATPCIIVSAWVENGWAKYLIETTTGAKYCVRDKDLILQ